MGGARDSGKSSAGSHVLTERSADLIAIIDSRGHLRYVNPSVTRILGYARDELLGQKLQDLVHPEDVDTLRAALEQARTHPGIGPRWECRFRHEDGSYRRLEATSCNLLDDPRVGGIVLDARDVTVRSQLEDQLRQIQKREAVGQLTAGIAHDFNNILSIIMANADLITEAIPVDRPNSRKDLDELKSAARSGAEMIKKLLGFTRQADVVPTLLDLQQIAADLAGLLERLLPAGIRIEVTAAEQVGLVRVDPTSVEQILFNLATNARDAMPDGGMLRIEVRQVAVDEAFCAGHPGSRPGDFVCVAVTDTGTGMDEATLGRLFDPFFTTKPAGKGTGLGMAMIYGLVKQYQGYVEVVSTLGEGTTVRVYFPQVKAERRARSTRFSIRMLRPGTETVLFVEDNESVQRAGAKALEKFGYTVLTAWDGEEALATFERHEAEIDLVITDIELPKIDGRELYAQLKRRGKNVRFVFSSGYASEEVRKNLEMTDDVFFVHKPWTMEELVRTVREALDDHP